MLIALCRLAALPLVVLAVPASLAQEPSEARSATESVRPEPSTGAKEMGPVDTSVSVAPRTANGHGQDRVERKPFKIVPPAHPPQHPAAAPAGGNVVRRNAVGVPVVVKDDTPPLDRAQVRPLAVPTGGIGPLANRRFGGVQPRIPPSHPPFSSLNHGRIDGSFLTRRAAAPSVLGGPARPVGEINGTTFRSQH